MRKTLIFYFSRSGNTHQVAKRIGLVFESYGWQSDLVMINEDTDINALNIDFLAYDFICLGSGVYFYAPAGELLKAIGKVSHKDSYRKITPGPKYGFAFATFGGAHLGKREAESATLTLEILYEHLGYKSIGSIAIPGRYPNYPTPEWYYPDLYLRPNENDLNDVESALRSIIESKDFEETYGRQQPIGSEEENI